MVENIIIDNIDTLNEYYKSVELPNEIKPEDIININIGILGHVDSGKTSLSKKISSIASTAAFDKNPQSKERGITLDIGFSAFYVLISNDLKDKFKENKRLQIAKYLQFTLVDCPGHASLIKTVVAGASIIDIVILVIDCNKGIQVQTTECLVLSEILSENLIVAFNKIDLLLDTAKEGVTIEMDYTCYENKFKSILTKKIEFLKKAFSKTKFGSKVCISPVCSITTTKESLYFDKLFKAFNKRLIDNIVNSVDFNKEVKTKEAYLNNKNFVYYIDHCFFIKNKGTIVTGTVLEGIIEPNTNVYFPELRSKKIVKEIQMFKKKLNYAIKGDRVGMLIKNLETTELERSIVCSENYNDIITTCKSGIFLIKKVKYYRSDIKYGTKFYIVVGNQGVTAKCYFFGDSVDLDTINKLDISNNKILEEKNNNLDLYLNELNLYNNKSSTEYVLKYEDELNVFVKYLKKFKLNIDKFYSTEFKYIPNYILENYSFAYIKFDNELTHVKDSLVIAINMDSDISNKENRLAFFGKMIDEYESNYNNCYNINQNSNKTKCNISKKQLKLVKNKIKTGNILRLSKENTAIIVNLFKKDSNISYFLGQKIKFTAYDELNINLTNEIKSLFELAEGKILSQFGQSGKVSVEFNINLKELIDKIQQTNNNEFDIKNLKLVLNYKKYAKLN